MASEMSDNSIPAFPEVGYLGDDYKPKFTGMSLRDWFAGQALAGFCACDRRPGDWTPQEIAADAYTYADAMLEARKR